MDLQTEDILKAKILKKQLKFHREAQSVKTVNLMDSDICQETEKFWGSGGKEQTTEKGLSQTVTARGLVRRE